MGCFETIEYHSKDKLFSVDELLNTNLFSRFNTYEVDDSFSGEYKDVGLRVSEVELILSGRKYYSSSFKGVIACFSFKKPIKAKTIVVTKRDSDVRNKMPMMIYVYTYLVPVVITICFFKGKIF